jgi:hypothetical protein
VRYAPGRPSCIRLDVHLATQVTHTSLERAPQALSGTGSAPHCGQETRFNPPLTSLDLLTTAHARDLLTRRLGPARVAREPVAMDDIKPCTATGERRLVVAASPI